MLIYKASGIQRDIHHKHSWGGCLLSGFSDKILADYPEGEFSIKAPDSP